jgi:hypothetical protein
MPIQKITLHSANIHKYTLLQDEILYFLSNKDISQKYEPSIYFVYDTIYYQPQIQKIFPHITFEESCMYDIITNKNGEHTLVEGQCGQIFICYNTYKRNYRKCYKFRCSYNNSPHRDETITPISIDEFNFNY